MHASTAVKLWRNQAPQLGAGKRASVAGRRPGRNLQRLGAALHWRLCCQCRCTDLGSVGPWCVCEVQALNPAVLKV